jgi:hypothetical protein
MGRGSCALSVYVTMPVVTMDATRQLSSVHARMVWHAGR